MDLGQFTVWNQVTDAMKWRRGRYGRECSLGRSASGADRMSGICEFGLGRSASGADLGLEFENSDST